MATYLIGYDLNRPGQNYPELFDAIKALGSWWHHLDSTWVVVATGTSTKSIADRLWPHLDPNDELLVVALGGEGSWRGFNDAGSKWLKQNL